MSRTDSNLTTKTPYIAPEAAAEASSLSDIATGLDAPTKRRAKEKRYAESQRTKVFVIDTSVLLHDHNAIRSFEDNRIAIPITCLLYTSDAADE